MGWRAYAIVAGSGAAVSPRPRRSPVPWPVGPPGQLHRKLGCARWRQ